MVVVALERELLAEVHQRETKEILKVAGSLDRKVGAGASQGTNPKAEPQAQLGQLKVCPQLVLNEELNGYQKDRVWIPCLLFFSLFGCLENVSLPCPFWRSQ